MPSVSFQELVRALSDPGAYPGSPATVECIQTHVSAVFLVDRLAYKVKRPTNLGFLDFTSLEARRHFCHEEVRLNRRLAPGVYEGVVPVVRERGAVRVSDRVVASNADEVEGEVLEWAVRMVRLPEDRKLGALLEAGAMDPRELDRLAARLASFHAAAEGGGKISEGASWETIRRNDRENFEQIEAFVGRMVSLPVFERLRALTAEELERRRPIFERRARRGVAKETHGDLRLDHIYLLPPGARGRSGEVGETEFVIVDCIEFNERFRWADPVSDIAFLVMELEFVGRADLASSFARAYFTSADDREGAELLPYYATYRDIVRGKVRSFQAQDDFLGARLRDEARGMAGRHFLRALHRLSPPKDRPALVVVMGLPGVGKSTVAEALGRAAGFRWIDTDRVRKELAASAAGAEEGYGAGMYSAEWNERTYRECRRRAREVLVDGGRAVVEGSFRREHHRVAFLEEAEQLGVPVLVFGCSVGAPEARRRLATRLSGPSDATWDVYLSMSRDWDPPSRRTAPHIRELPLEGTPENALAQALGVLAREGLA